jgi:uncharacterized protein YutE (UPF0331/DUF86 family)
VSVPTTFPDIAAVAAYYRQRGYEVTADPTPDLLPQPVRDYQPDFLATREDERVAVEVKRRRNLSADVQLSRLAEMFRKIPGWRLDVALIDDRVGPTTVSPMADHQIRRRLSSLDKLVADTGDLPAALLLLWTVIEAVLRNRMKEDEGDPVASPGKLVKRAFSLGVIEEEGLHFLESIVKLRNQVVHGHESPDVSNRLYQQTRAFVDRLLVAPVK